MSIGNRKTGRAPARRGTIVATVAVIVVLAGGGLPDLCLAQAVDHLVISEVYYDAPGADTGLEWVELYNGFSEPVDLCEYRLAWGGEWYDYAQVQLEGVVEPGAYFVVGGPTSSELNGYPVFDLVRELTLQNSGLIADGVALYHLGYEAVHGRSLSVQVPVDAVIYGESNDNMLIDEEGEWAPPDVGDAPAGQSLERVDAATWTIQPLINPGEGSLAYGGGALPPAVECDPPPPPPPAKVEAVPLDSLESSYRLQLGSWGDNLEPVFIDTVVALPWLTVGERLAGQQLLSADPDLLGGEPTDPVTAVAGLPGDNLSLWTRPPDNGETNVLFGATGTQIAGLGGSLGLVFAQDQSQVGLELQLYTYYSLPDSGQTDLRVSFYERDGTSLGALVLSLPHAPLDSLYTVGFRHEDRLVEIAAMTLEWLGTYRTGCGITAIRFVSPLTGVGEGDDPGRPAAAVLRGARPNPFNPRTTIRFHLERAGRVRLAVFDLAGRQRAVLADGDLAAGDHTVIWNGLGTGGRPLPSGSYLVRLETAAGVATEKVTLLR